MPRCCAKWNLSKTIFRAASATCVLTEFTYGSLMSIATASIPLSCPSVSVPQKRSRLSCLRSSATYRTRPRFRSFTTAMYLCPLRKSLLVHSQVGDGFGLAPGQPAPDGPVHNAVDFVPAKPQLVAHRLLTGGFQPGNGKCFEQRGEAAGGLGPGQLHHTHAVSRAPGAGRLGVQDGAVLTGIQVAPLPCGLMVIDFTGCAALGTGPGGAVFMCQMDMHLPRCQMHVHRLHPPGALNAEDAAIKFTTFHAYWIAVHPARVHTSSLGLAGGMHKGGGSPLLWGEPPGSGGVGGTFPAPAFPPEGEKGKGGFRFLAAAGCLPTRQRQSAAARDSSEVIYRHYNSRNFRLFRIGRFSVTKIFDLNLF
jgi:hypothetical protein